MGFQSAPLMRGATPHTGKFIRSLGVSIRAPHARGDSSRSCRRGGTGCFNPRPSCEGRHGPSGNELGRAVFQSAPLMRGATSIGRGDAEDVVVSIRAPHARGDWAHGEFNGVLVVSIRAPHARGDGADHDAGLPALVSIRAPHARGDSVYLARRGRFFGFNPRPSCEGRPAAVRSCG